MSDTYSGQVLYHYTSLDVLHSILKSRCIRATAIQDLADENELVYGRELVAREFEREARRNRGTAASSRFDVCAKCTRVLPDISELIRIAGHEPIQDDAKFEWYVACFSDCRDSLPLWRGFTDRCSGYAIGLRYRHPEHIIAPLVHSAPRRVVYSRAGQRAAVRRTVTESCAQMDNMDDPFAWTIPLGSILTLKSALFASEREWRVVWSESAQFALPKGEYCPEGHTRPVHYVELPLADWDLIEIVCGPRAHVMPGAIEICKSIEAFGSQPGSVAVSRSASRLWR
jgi:hypothetical protein